MARTDMRRVVAGTSPLAPYVSNLACRVHHEQWSAVPGTLCFADISGFTQLSERLARSGQVGAEELTVLLNETFTDLLDVAMAAGGDLLKFGGDALCLFFDGEHHARRAVRAAVEMRAALRARGPIVTERGAVTLRMSQGVHSGTFDCASVGVTQRELVVTGADVSCTLAMEAAADPGEILVSARTASQLPTSVLGRVKGTGVRIRRAPDESSAPLVTGPVLTPRELELHVPPALRDRLAAGIEEPEHRHVTIGFVHFSGTDAPTSGAPDIAYRLTRLSEIIEDVAARHDICLLASDVAADGGKFILTAGAPGAGADGEGRMLRAALAILGSELPLPVRVGVHAGPVFAGDVGAPFRRTYTVMGDTVNLAARLMARADPGTCVASRAVVDQSRSPFDTRTLAPFLVKGKRRPIDAVEVVGVRDGAEHSVRRDVMFVGRRPELDALRVGLDRAHAGAGAVVEVVGDIGIGKSRLALELAGRRDDVRVLRLLCEPFQTDRAYFASSRILRAVFEIANDADALAAGAQLSARFAGAGPEIEPWLPLVAAATGATVPSTREVERLAPQFRTDRLHRAVATAVGLVLSEPTVLIIDDAAWMDDASAALYASLFQQVGTVPWLICITSRSVDRGLRRELGFDADRVALEPLGLEAALELATHAAADAPLADHVLADIAARSHGNPMFVLELVDAMKRGDSLDALPSTLEAVLAERIDALSLQERRLLRYAAVLGSWFRTGLARSVLGELLPEVSEEALAGLGHFLEPMPDGFRFRNELVRRVAYGALPYARRRELHARAAEALEAAQGDEVADVLSMHYEAARLWDRAWHYSRLAGDSARDRYANVEAAAFYQRALACASHERPPDDDVATVAEALGDVSELLGRYDEALAAYSVARRSTGLPHPAAARLLRKTGLVQERAGRYRSALGWHRRSLEAATGTDVAQASVAIASVRYWQGRFAACIEWCRKAVAEAEATGDRAALAHAYHLLHLTYTDLNDDARFELRDRALPIYEELDDPLGQGNALTNLGIDYARQGDWETALEMWDRGREAFERAGDVVGAAGMTHNIGEQLASIGRLAEAEVRHAEARRVWTAARFTLGAASATSGLGRSLARAGRDADAMPLLFEALHTFADLGRGTEVIETETRIVEAHVLAGRWAEAIALADASLARATGPEYGESVAALHRGRGWALLASGDVDGARAAFAISLDVAREHDLEVEYASTLAVRATVQSDPVEADADRETARSIFAVLRATPSWLPLDVPAGP